jgi:hypothetical protein
MKYTTLSPPLHPKKSEARKTLFNTHYIILHNFKLFLAYFPYFEKIKVGL